jgi:hypothetical protein
MGTTNALGFLFQPYSFEISGRPVTFQSQSTWLLMTPIIYLITIYLNKKSLKNEVN